MVSAVDLKRAEWVRACLGHPRLILLERPEQGVPGDGLARLADMVASAAADGAAIVWMTGDKDLFADKRLTATRRFSIENGEWVAESGG